MLVSTINATGAAIESIYVLIFLMYAQRKTRARSWGFSPSCSLYLPRSPSFPVSPFTATAERSSLALQPLSFPSSCTLRLSRSWSRSADLYAIYRDKKGETKEESADGSLEMGLGKPKPEKQSDM
ncbi:hypothetical protein C3L33_21570, partial [Rhododendron williamsianum]